MTATDLFSWTPPELPQPDRKRAFDGKSYEPPQDYARMNKQLRAVFDLMKDGQERAPAEIAFHVDGSDAALTARLRDLRKPKYGGHTVNCRRIHKGLYAYRLILNTEQTS